MRRDTPSNAKSPKCGSPNEPHFWRYGTESAASTSTPSAITSRRNDLPLARNQKGVPIWCPTLSRYGEHKYSPTFYGSPRFEPDSRGRGVCGRGDEPAAPDATAAATVVEEPTTSVEVVITEPSTTDAGHTHDGEDGHTHDSTTTVDPDRNRVTWEELGEIIEEQTPIVGEDVVNEDGSIGTTIDSDTIPPQLLPEPVVVTAPPTTAPATTEPVDTTTTVTPTTTIWREATERIPAESTTTWLQEDPMMSNVEGWITYGASGPFRLEPGMRLTTDLAWVDGASIIGIVFYNNSIDSIFMYLCIERLDPEGSPTNVVGAWKLARTDTENEYLVLYVINKADGRRTAGVTVRRTPEEWEERLSYYPHSPLHDFDVSECW